MLCLCLGMPCLCLLMPLLGERHVASIGDSMPLRVASMNRRLGEASSRCINRLLMQRDALRGEASIGKDKACLGTDSEPIDASPSRLLMLRDAASIGLCNVTLSLLPRDALM